MIIYTFLVNETAAICQLLHISMCNLKYVTPLSGAALITRCMVTKDDRGTCRSPTIQYESNTILTKNNFCCNWKQKP